MEYQKVESSQIAEVGFGDGVYGPETLALRFPPNKKQKEAGLPGSEYHYGNDRARYTAAETYQRLMAAPSIGSWFGQNIKPFPEQYPFTLVESDPAQPSAQSPKSSGKTNTAITEETITDAPSPGTALALMNDMADDKLFSPGSITDVQLAQMRSDWLTEAKKYDISTDKARTELKRFARPLQKLRTGIEARAKELTGATKRKIAAIDAEKRRLVLVVGGIEDDVLRPLTEWEQEEETRKMRLAHDVQAFADAAQVYRYPDTVSLGAAIVELENADISKFQEYKVGAESAIASSLKVLKPELERRKVAEAERAELERLRVESAARAEADRLAEAKRQEEARIAAAAQKLADEQTQARLDAAVNAALEERAELERVRADAEERAAQAERATEPAPPIPPVTVEPYVYQ